MSKSNAGSGLEAFVPLVVREQQVVHRIGRSFVRLSREAVEFEDKAVGPVPAAYAETTGNSGSFSYWVRMLRNVELELIGSPFGMVPVQPEGMKISVVI